MSGGCGVGKGEGGLVLVDLDSEWDGELNGTLYCTSI